LSWLFLLLFSNIRNFGVQAYMFWIRSGSCSILSASYNSFMCNAVVLLLLNDFTRVQAAQVERIRDKLREEALVNEHDGSKKDDASRSGAEYENI
jgi:hypothetical protein